MKHLKTFKLYESDSEDFNPYDDEPLTNSERMFGKQTRLEKQFSEIVVNGLINDTKEGFWSTFNALKGEIKFLIDIEKYKEFMHRLIEGEKPQQLIEDMFSDLPYDEEGTRLYTKFMRLKSY